MLIPAGGTDGKELRSSACIWMSTNQRDSPKQLQIKLPRAEMTDLT